MEIEESYLRARALPQFRQPFLDEVDLREYAKYVSKVKYAPKGGILEQCLVGTGGMANFQLNPMGWFFRGFKSSIAVDERPFLFVENPYDFMNMLLHHEGEHAKQRFENPGALAKQIKLMEARALQNQVRNLDPRCSRPYKEAVCILAIKLTLSLPRSRKRD